MPTMQARQGRVTFATGRAGSIPTPAERLARLRAEAELRRRIFRARPNHFNEIELAKAELAVDEFEEAHPELT